jgi:hypothetical protein
MRSSGSLVGIGAEAPAAVANTSWYAVAPRSRRNGRRCIAPIVATAKSRR